MTEKFPSRSYDTPEDYFRAYSINIAEAWRTIDQTAIAHGAKLLRECLVRDGIIYACGNGGSAAIANHLLCDFQKGIQTNTTIKPRVVSLSSHLELITAIANDISYDDIFVYQLNTMARPGDLLMTISCIRQFRKYRARGAMGKDKMTFQQFPWWVFRVVARRP